MEALRDEILESQKTRTELIKWKLILVAGIGAVGLGLTDATGIPNSELVLCFIPFVCAYVDLLSHHESLKISVIGEFIRTYDTSNSLEKETFDLVKYEVFAWKMRYLTSAKSRKIISAFELEKYALSWSSIALSSSLFAFAFLQIGKLSSIFLALAGILGAILSFWTIWSYRIRREAVREHAIKEIADLRIIRAQDAPPLKNTQEQQKTSG